MTWVHLCASPSMTGIVPTSLMSCMSGFTKGFPFLSTEFLTSNTTSSIILGNSTGSRLKRFEACFEVCEAMLAISMMLITRSRSLLAQLKTMFICLARVSSSSDSQRRSMRPMMPCNGLRSSCDTIAMKRVFRASASLKAATSVRSQPIKVTPVVTPILFISGAALNINFGVLTFTGIAAVFFESRSSMVTSKKPGSSLARALVIIASQSALRELGNKLDKCAPRTYFPGKPVSSAAFRFHWLILPWQSVPKIGTLAVWRRWEKSASSAFARLCISSLKSRSFVARTIMEVPSLKDASPKQYNLFSKDVDIHPGIGRRYNTP
mmetsp:Transcript_116151/g.328645  ORF Transcript_116151/g.328645 Transcript_116151/m.328645 type:complete len:322 (+) Transcript_116151:88-1053(+)